MTFYIHADDEVFMSREREREREREKEKPYYYMLNYDPFIYMQMMRYICPENEI